PAGGGAGGGGGLGQRGGGRGGGEGRHLGQAGDRRVTRAGHAQAGQSLAHRQLVLGVVQSTRARADRHHLLQRGQVRAGNVFVVERDHVAAGGEREQVVPAGIVPDLH